MKFTLRYSGNDLLSSGNSNKKQEKQVLRQAFHRQLKRLWDQNGVFREVDRRSLPTAIRNTKLDTYDLPRPLPPIMLGRPSIQGFLFTVKYHGADFVPIVTYPMKASCALALRIGRPTKRGGLIFHGGDLDGRLKTLFDALAAPRDEFAVDPGDVVETEYVCLLSDDSLITALSIESYELLEECDEDFIDVEIAVTVTATVPMNGTMALLFG